MHGCCRGKEAPMSVKTNLCSKREHSKVVCRITVFFPFTFFWLLFCLYYERWFLWTAGILECYPTLPVRTVWWVEGVIEAIFPTGNDWLVSFFSMSASSTTSLVLRGCCDLLICLPTSSDAYAVVRALVYSNVFTLRVLNIESCVLHMCELFILVSHSLFITSTMVGNPRQRIVGR